MLVQPSRGKFHFQRNIATRKLVEHSNARTGALCAGEEAYMRGRVVLYACADYKFLRVFVRMRGINCRSVTPRSSVSLGAMRIR